MDRLAFPRTFFCLSSPIVSFLTFAQLKSTPCGEPPRRNEILYLVAPAGAIHSLRVNIFPSRGSLPGRVSSFSLDVHSRRAFVEPHGDLSISGSKILACSYIGSRYSVAVMISSGGVLSFSLSLISKHKIISTEAIEHSFTSRTLVNELLV